MRLATSILVICVGALLSLGIVMLYSATMSWGGSSVLMMQAGCSVLGIVAMTCCAWIDYRRLKSWVWPLWAVVVILLVLVRIPGIGDERNGAWRWFDFGPVSFQPSELGKVSLILMLAWYGHEYQRHVRTFWRGLVLPGLLAGVIVGLIFIEPDRGTAILLSAITGTLLLVAGVKWRYIIGPSIAVMAVLVVLLWNDNVPRQRLEAWLDPEQHRQGAAYQTWRAMVAFGSGGVTGLGLGDSRHKMGYLPEHQTDFILSIIGEELGLVGSLGIVIAFVALVLSGLYIAWHAGDQFGLLIGTGITFLIGLQAFVNLGVVTGLLPNKGLPLPFISYGGSNLLLMLGCVGLLLSIARHSPVAGEGGRNPFGSSRELAASLGR